MPSATADIQTGTDGQAFKARLLDCTSISAAPDYVFEFWRVGRRNGNDPYTIVSTSYYRTYLATKLYRKISRKF